MKVIRWKCITDYPNYKISDTGLVYNCITKSYKKPRKDKDGYLTVSLWKDGFEKNYKIHRLVALHFVDGYFDGAVVNHKDEDKENNHYSNLEWCTIHYNNHYNGKVARTFKPILMYTLDGDFVREFESIRSASSHFNKSPSNLVSHLKGKQKTFSKHIFKYKEDE